MKALKSIVKVLVIILILAGLFIGFKFGNKFYTFYQARNSLTNTILDNELKPADLEAAENLEPGKIYSKKLIQLSEIPPLWEDVSEENKLKEKYKYLGELDFFLITYKSDSMLVNGIVVEPKRSGKFPVVIFNRGGNKEVGKVSKAKTLYTLAFTASKLAQEGYVVIASCYRENDEFGGKDINDVLVLTETIQELEKADPDRIGMFGWSRGGMMTYLALQKSDLITTAVVGNGPADLSELIIDRPQMETRVYAKLIPDYQRNKEEELKKRSVVYWADELSKKSSLLILSATEDKRVNPNQADKIAQKLKEINYDFEIRKYKTDHSFSDKKDELDSLLIQWFNERL